jgi:hypothetical protein
VKIALALFAITVAGSAHAQLPPYAPIEPGYGLASRGGGAGILQVESTGGRGIVEMTPTMRRQRTEQIMALHTEVQKLLAARGGMLSDADRTHISQEASYIVGNRR